MKRNDAQFKVMVQRIQSGELTRLQAAAAYDINPGTLNVWLSRSNLGGSTKAQTRELAGAALGWSTLSPDNAKALAEATARVLAGEMTVTQAHKLYPQLVYITIAKRVSKERAKLSEQLTTPS